jgi:hypothetical protein
MFMIHKWFQALDGTGSLVRVCLLDFSKAFDKIDHNVLINKLRDMNFILYWSTGSLHSYLVVFNV